MIRLIVAAIILIVIMLIFVFMLFKNIIGRIDQNAKKYFVNKMQNYDYILEKKQSDLADLNEQIEKVKSDNRNILKNDEIDEDLEEIEEKTKKTKEDIFAEENIPAKKEEASIRYNLEVPNYRDSMQFFSNYKELKKIFTVNNEEIITEFVNEHTNLKEEKKYYNLKKIRDKFDDKSIYECITLDNAEQIKILEELLDDKDRKLIDFDTMISKNKKFNINDVINYIDIKMQEIDPTIYVYVNEVNLNYNHLSKNIVTKQYSNMAEGIIIKYRNKVYDYSI